MSPTEHPKELVWPKLGVMEGDIQEITNKVIQGTRHREKQSF